MRKRLLNPDLYRDEVLAEVPIEARYLFSGLWCIADREGRLEDRPARIKADIFPYDDLAVAVVDQWLTKLHPRWIIRYVVDCKPLIHILTFAKHQRCHPNEPKSKLPPVPDGLPMVNHGLPIVTNKTKCQSVDGIRYTVDSTPPYPPQGGSCVPTPPLKPRRTKQHEYTVDFLDLWATYPRKDAKYGAFLVWRALLEDDKQAAKRNLPILLPDILRKISADGGDTTHCPQFQTWLRQKRWEQADELDITEKPKQWPPPGAIMGEW